MLAPVEEKGRVESRYLEVIGPNLDSKIKASILAMVEPIRSEEALNAPQESSNRSLLESAFHAGTEHLIGLCSFAQTLGYRFKQSHIDNVFRLALYREGSRRDRLLSLQFLTSYFDLPKEIYYDAGLRADTQGLLTILSAAPLEKRAVALGESLCGLLEQAGRYSYQHIKLLFELGVNPHYRSFRAGQYHNYMRYLCLWGVRNDPNNKNLERAELFSYLLSALNSKVVNANRSKYAISLLAYYKATLENDTALEDLFHLNDPAVPVVEKMPGDGNLLHWAANCGHEEIIDDIVASFIEHGYGKYLFVYNADGGYTPLGCVVFHINALTREVEGLAEGDEERAELALKLENYKRIAQKLIIAGLRLGNEGFRFSRLKPSELDYISKWLDSETNSEALNTQFANYLKRLAEGSSRKAVAEFMDPTLASGTNFAAHQAVLSAYFNDQNHSSSSLLHWVVEADHPELMTGTLKTFCNYGIPVHSTDKGGKSALVLARELGEREWMEGALGSIPDSVLYHQVPSLMQMCMSKVRQKLINGDDASDLREDQCKALEEIKPNYRIVPFLDRRYYSDPNRTLLMSLCEKKDKDRINALLPYLVDEDFTAVDMSGNSVMHLVCAQRQGDLLAILRINGYLSWAKNKQGNSPLHILIKAGDWDMIAIYLGMTIFDRAAHPILATRDNQGLIPLLCGSSEWREFIDSDQSYFGRAFRESLQGDMAKAIAEVTLPIIDKLSQESTIFGLTGLLDKSFIKDLRDLLDQNLDYREAPKKVDLRILFRFTDYLLSMDPKIPGMFFGQDSEEYKLIHSLASTPTFRVGLSLNAKLLEEQDFDAHAVSQRIICELERVAGPRPVVQTAAIPDKKEADSKQSQPKAEGGKSLEGSVVDFNKAAADVAAQLLDSARTGLLNDAKKGVLTAINNPTNPAKVHYLLRAARQCEAEGSAVWIALGIAMVGVAIAIMGALMLAVSAGAISTGFLAPLGVAGGKLGAGIITAGVATLVAGIGFYCESCPDLPDQDENRTYLTI
jgi:ankyrin repeat protein